LHDSGSRRWFRTSDAGDVSAEIGERHHAERARSPAFELDHPEARQRTGHALPSLVVAPHPMN
jgi:hypothetical protein